MTLFHFLDLQGTLVLTQDRRYQPEVTISKKTPGPAHQPTVLLCLQKRDAVPSHHYPPCPGRMRLYHATARRFGRDGWEHWLGV